MISTLKNNHLGNKYCSTKGSRCLFPLENESGFCTGFPYLPITMGQHSKTVSYRRKGSRVPAERPVGTLAWHPPQAQARVPPSQPFLAPDNASIFWVVEDDSAAVPSFPLNRFPPSISKLKRKWEKKEKKGAC